MQALCILCRQQQLSCNGLHLACRLSACRLFLTHAARRANRCNGHWASPEIWGGHSGLTCGDGDRVGVAAPSVGGRQGARSHFFSTVTRGCSSVEVLLITRQHLLLHSSGPCRGAHLQPKCAACLLIRSRCCVLLCRTHARACRQTALTMQPLCF